MLDVRLYAETNEIRGCLYGILDIMLKDLGLQNRPFTGLAF
jgi:hypothetical protein